MKIEHIVVGPLQVNCYLIYDEESRDALVIDPGADPQRILKAINTLGLNVTHIICTHGHFDHVGAVASVKGKTGAPVLINKEDLDIYSNAPAQAAFWEYEVEPPPQPDGFAGEGDEFTVGRSTLRVLHTPGHSPGGMCLYGGGVIITGDTVFAGSVGRTDFPGGSLEELRQSFRKIIAFPPETAILPGHGPASTVGEELSSNFFMQEI